MKRNKRITLWAVAFVAIVALLIFAPTANADAFVQKCNYTNDCETWSDAQLEIKAVKNGIRVSGSAPANPDLSSTGDPVRLVVTDGDIYTQCSNDYGFKSITGNVLINVILQPGEVFDFYLELPEGDYNFTWMIAQDNCANCPQYGVQPITVKHKGCKPTGNYVYTIPGKNFDCVTEPVSPELGGGTWAISRFKNPSYTETFCFWCGTAQTGADHNSVTMRAETTCDTLPECYNCP